MAAAVAPEAAERTVVRRMQVPEALAAEPVATDWMDAVVAEGLAAASVAVAAAAGQTERLPSEVVAVQQAEAAA